MLKNARLPILAAFLLSAATASAAIPSAERQTLVSLYSSAGGSAWFHRTGWNGAAGTECSWYGVTCDAAGGHVTGINLDGNNLSGTIPSLSGLPSLLYLILSNNRLTGAIPPVSSLTSLRILELYANGDISVDQNHLPNDEALLPLAREGHAKSADLRAVIKADGTVQHQRVIHVLDLLKQAGISKIAFGVTPVAPEPGGTAAPAVSR